MRTRHILTALALPALFAACTADEFETVNQNTGLQEERAKVAENFTLLTSGIQTRYSVEGGAGISFNFEKGDRIGAAIVDQKEVGQEKPEDFTVIYSLAGNYPFEFQGNDQWQSYTQLGIGHYLFIYPYNASDNNRSAMAYELPVIQELGEGAEGLNAAVEKGNKAIAAAILHEGEESVDISLKNLFTYPKLTINFDNGEDVTTVSQIVLRADNDESAFTVKGGFDHKVVSDLFSLDEEKGNSAFDGKDFYKKDKTTEKFSIDWNLVDTKDFLLAENGVNKGYIPFDENELKSDYIIVKFPEGTKVKPAANTDNKYVEARIIMPSIEKFKNDDEEHNYTLYVYTDNGVYSTAFEPSSFSFSDRTDTEKIETALARSASNGLTLKALNASNKQGDAGTIVTTLADWNDLVDRFGDTKQNQKIIIVGDDFAFDGAKNIEWPETCTFTITTDVKVKGNVEMKNVNVDGTINVEKGATLTVNNTLTAEKEEVEFADGTALTDIETVIKNEGTVVIAAEYDKAKFEDNNKVKDYYVGISAIENKGTLTVNKEAKAEFALTNIRKAVVNNNGEVTVKNDNYYEDVKDENEAGNNGTINNNGTLRTGNFTNVAPEIENEGKENEVIKNMPVINNAKGARMVAEGNFANNATLVNEGTLACLNTTTGTITNARTLDSKKGAVTYITDNNGKVIVYEAKPLTVTINGAKGIVEYETSAKSEDFKESLVNHVIASGDLTIADGTISMLTFEGDATLTLAKPAGTSTKEGVINGLTIEEGNVVLASDVTVSTLIIKEEGSLNVPSNITMTYSGEDATNFNNEGLILVGGTFSAEKVNMADGGDVQNNGGKITWAKTDKDTAYEAYKDALVAAVKAWADVNKPDGTNVVNSLSFDIISGTNSKNELSAAASFEQYCTGNQSIEVQKAVVDALDAYNSTYNEGIELTKEYAYAAKKVVEDREAEDEFKELKLTWTAANTGGEDSHIFEEEADAVKAFKAAVANGTVSVTETLDKVVLCSSSNNYMPEGSYVLESEDIYKLFEVISSQTRWKDLDEKMTNEYISTSKWTLDDTRQWISDIMNSESTKVAIQDAKDYITSSDLWNKSKNWKYQDNIVKGIATEWYSAE